MIMEVRQFVVDRIEGNRVVLEGLGAVPSALLPASIREGDVIALHHQARCVEIAIVEATSREEEASTLRESLPRADGSDNKLFELDE